MRHTTKAPRAALKAPFPYFGGKSKIAHEVWTRFGDVKNYVEPFAGSLAVLWLRGRRSRGPRRTWLVGPILEGSRRIWKSVKEETKHEPIPRTNLVLTALPACAMSRKDYDEYKNRQAEISRERSEKGRDIGPLPEVIDPARREECQGSFRQFCEIYLAARFPLAWSEDHLKAISRIEACATHGGQFAFAMPRGSGKTSLCEAGAIWAVCNALRRFVVLIGATETAAEEMLDSLKVEFETNELLLEDFPEICFPIVMLDGIANRAKGQTLGGARTRIEWTQKSIKLPTVEGSAACRAAYATTLSVQLGKRWPNGRSVPAREKGTTGDSKQRAVDTSFSTRTFGRPLSPSDSPQRPPLPDVCRFSAIRLLLTNSSRIM